MLRVQGLAWFVCAVGLAQVKLPVLLARSPRPKHGIRHFRRSGAKRLENMSQHGCDLPPFDGTSVSIGGPAYQPVDILCKFMNY